MDHRGGDDLLDRVVGELRELPPLDESQVMRVVAAATAADREAEENGERGGLRLVRPARERWFAARHLPFAWAAGLMLASGLGGYLVGERGTKQLASERPVATSQVLLPVSNDEESTVPLTQFMIAAPEAEQVALVGDFNGWDPAATPLVRDPSSGLWTASLRLAPGRHSYAFMVDTVLTLDPRAPESRDPDLGTRSSVVLVGAGGR